MGAQTNKRELIDELNHISHLYQERQNIKSALMQMNCIEKEENEDIAKKHFADLQEYQANAEKVCKHKPKFNSNYTTATPARPEKPEIDKNGEKIFRNIYVTFISYVFAIFSIVFFVVSVISDVGNGGAILSVLMLFAGVGFWILRNFIDLNNSNIIFEWMDKYEKYEKERENWEINFNKIKFEEENARFFKEFKEYDDDFFKLIDICSQKYREAKKEFYIVATELEKKQKLRAKQKLDELSNVEKQLEGITLIHSDLFHNAQRIADILKMGRADTLKEAINLSLDEERKEQEEEMRREEAREQAAILEQQAQDNERHNLAMQRAAAEELAAMREHNNAMERAARAQADEARRQTELAQKAQTQAKQAAEARCAHCINYSKCSYYVRKNAINCSSYRPK